ncbi:MAG TPA: universal stress protein, partial [Kofleriaceae bacterium]
MKLRKVLCTTDFSAGSDAALRVAVRLSHERTCELVVLHAWSVPSIAFFDGFSYSSALIEAIASDAGRGLAARVAEARGLGAHRVTGKLTEGPAWRSIVTLAEVDRTIDLVVIGSRGRTGSPRRFLGSTAEMVVRHAPCSVMTVPETASLAPFEHIVAAIDFSASSHHALELGLALTPSATALRLFHVIERPIVYSEEPAVEMLELEAQRVLARRSR